MAPEVEACIRFLERGGGEAIIRPTSRRSDQILVVAEGRIVERGNHAELLAAGGLHDELYRTQFAVQATGGATAGEALRP